MEEKTMHALRWIVSIFNKHNVDYQIAGGFAAKVYGSQRKLNDIDIDIHEDDFQKILPEISQYVLFGPARFKDGKWDCELITLNYKGQEIDIGGADTLRMSNKERTKWISYEKSPFNAVEMSVGGIDVKIIPPAELVDYKKELDGEHQLEDIKAAKNYIINESKI